MTIFDFNKMARDQGYENVSDFIFGKKKVDKQNDKKYCNLMNKECNSFLMIIGFTVVFILFLVIIFFSLTKFGHFS